jgi:hypothetical protein
VNWNRAALFFVWLQREARELLRTDGRASCASGLGTERLRPIDFFWSGMVPDLRKIFPNWSHSILVTL